MITKDQAIDLVNDQLRKMDTPDFPFMIAERHTIDKPYGWVFFYNSKKFLETGEFLYRLAGNGPIILNKFTGEIRRSTSGRCRGRVSS